MKKTFGDCEEAAQHWIEFAEWCVSEKQYAGCKKERKKRAVQKWLLYTFSALCYANDLVGDIVVKTAIDLTPRHCLYPYEIIGLAEHIKEGGTTEDLEQRSNNGFYDTNTKIKLLDKYAMWYHKGGKPI